MPSDRPHAVRDLVIQCGHDRPSQQVAYLDDGIMAGQRYPLAGRINGDPTGLRPFDQILFQLTAGQVVQTNRTIAA